MTDGPDPALLRSERTRGSATSASLAGDVREMVREQREYVELLYALVRRDLSLRYQNSFMGFGWAVFAPLLQMLIFSVVFTRVVPLETDSPYDDPYTSGIKPARDEWYGKWVTVQPIR